jgi:hypothetical protein
MVEEMDAGRGSAFCGEVAKSGSSASTSDFADRLLSPRSIHVTFFERPILTQVT